jgi:hypothetical protein
MQDHKNQSCLGELGKRRVGRIEKARKELLVLVESFSIT